MTTALRQNPDVARPAVSLAESYAFCRRLTKQQAANFYYGMKLLPEPKRSAMYALYAYMRLVDDIADDDAHVRTLEQRRSDLDHWEQLTNEAVSGTLASDGHDSPIWPAFADMVKTREVPGPVFRDMIAGQRQDLEFTPIRTFDDLYQYCYRVASVVGIASLYVWGFEGGDASLALSVDRGIAFQLTNVLRDLREDGARGRCYLPTEELERFGLTAEQLASPELATSPKFLDFMRFQIDRTRSYYEKSMPLKAKVAADSRPTLVAMTAIYRGILEKIAADPGQVLRGRVRLSTLSKLLIGWRAMRGK
jgi:phytoene synthase